MEEGYQLPVAGCQWYPIRGEDPCREEGRFSRGGPSEDRHEGSRKEESFLAATAKVHGLTLAAGNIKRPELDRHRRVQPFGTAV